MDINAWIASWVPKCADGGSRARLARNCQSVGLAGTKWRGFAVMICAVMMAARSRSEQDFRGQGRAVQADCAALFC